MGDMHAAMGHVEPVASHMEPPPAAATGRWQLDPSTLDVRFTAWHMMIAAIEGRFTRVQGSIAIDGADLFTARVELSVDAASVDTREPQRDEHLRSGDFLDVGQYPTITFTSRRVDQLSDGDVRVIGDLTIRGVTREAGFDIQPAISADDLRTAHRLKFTARAAISRSQFGLTWNRVLEGGGVLVGDEIRVTIGAELAHTIRAA